ncbi:MAG: Gfo/Idh/MocA family oxidoreductase [Clostridiales Family XIII bacterium]|jgi:predicted dehydrogenase|nr:Gfo/Idh/MocA family oxidoreductase [Clostridiales Family XIII bacterium]
MNIVKVGIVGCGNISDIYFSNIALFNNIEVYACADIDVGRAEAKADAYGCKALTVDGMLADPDVEVILNLTIPLAHYEVSMAALNAGKHVYSEKSLAVTLEDGEAIIALAKSKGLLVGCAPDTFLGSRPQTMRKMIDDGWIGRPIAATGFMTCHGHEVWHPGPEFYYKKGAGPLYDMGPYYVTALIALLGPAKRVCGMEKISFKERMITSQPLAGKMIDVEVPTHTAGTIEFVNGTIATLITSFDIWDSNLPRLEIYGSEGTISMDEADPLAGPDIFEGVTKYRRRDKADWNGFPTTIPRNEKTPWDGIPSCYDYATNSRGVGLADMARAIREGGRFRANGDMAYHALEIMVGLSRSSESGQYYEVKSTCSLPELLPVDQVEYMMGK